MEQHYATIFAPSPHLGLVVLTPPTFDLYVAHRTPINESHGCGRGHGRDPQQKPSC